MQRQRRPSLAIDPAATPPALELSLHTAAVPVSLTALHGLLNDFWQAVDLRLNPPPASDRRAAFVTAIGEIASNIMRYAYPDSADGTMTFTLRAWETWLEARFIDRGVPFEFATPPPPTVLDDDDLLTLPEGGFGLALAQAALDQLEYQRSPADENIWTLGISFAPTTDEVIERLA